jgi:hypothetical protein
MWNLGKQIMENMVKQEFHAREFIGSGPWEGMNPCIYAYPSSIATTSSQLPSDPNAPGEAAVRDFRF